MVDITLGAMAMCAFELLEQEEAFLSMYRKVNDDTEELAHFVGASRRGKIPQIGNYYELTVPTHTDF